MKKIYEKSFNRSKLISIEGGVFTFKGIRISLEDEHQGDCCENVYADFSTLELYKSQLVGIEFEKFEIAEVEGDGILLRFDKGQHSTPVKVFIPCYNEQNGYYSSELKLVIKVDDNPPTTIDISSAHEDVDK
jgi:hypothetical protein